MAAPRAVMVATEKYRDDEDVLARFLAERCIIDPDYHCRASDLWSDFNQWQQFNSAKGSAQWKQRNLGLALTARGFEKFTNNGTCYRGLELRPAEFDREAA